MKNSDLKSDLASQFQPSSVNQAVAWLKLRQPKMVDELAQEMSNSSAIPVHWLPNFLRKAVARDMIDDLIIRLDENVFDQQAAIEKMLTALKRGASIKSIEASINLMLLVITRNAQTELMSQPALYKAVIDKTDYFSNLIKACLSAAIIEHSKIQSKGKNNHPA